MCPLWHSDAPTQQTQTSTLPSPITDTDAPTQHAPTTGPPRDTLPPASMQFTGAFAGTTWNTQALFARKTGRQQAKRRHAMRLADNYDFAGLQETHSTQGSVRAMCLPDSIRHFWSHGSTRQAGIGVLVKKVFSPISTYRQTMTGSRLSQGVRPYYASAAPTAHLTSSWFTTTRATAPQPDRPETRHAHSFRPPSDPSHRLYLS